MTWRWKVAMLALLLLLLRGPALLSRAMGNAGMAALRDAVAFEAADPDGSLGLGVYPLYDVLAEREGETAMAMLKQAVAADSDSLSARWGLGRAALVAGDAASAADALESLSGGVEHNPLLYHDALTAFSYDGRSAEVIALYEAVPPPERTRAVSDTVALAYLDLVTGRQGDKGIRRQKEGETRGLLGQVKELRPGDLYANYHLWKEARQGSDLQAARAYSETLTYFPLEAINPGDERVLDYVVEVIPNLLEEGLWERDKMLNVASYLVWQHNGATGVERLLERLVERYPTEPDWPFYLAELYHRRGDLGRAEAVYRQVLAVDPNYARAYLRLGMVVGANRQGLGEVAGWYEDYRDLVPDDLLALKRLTEVYGALGRPHGAVREELEAKTGDRCIVAELLGVPVRSVELGSNLVENGGFEDWDDARPTGWWVSDMATGDPWNKGLFVEGADQFISWEGTASRIVGLWRQRREWKEPARSGYWYSSSNDYTSQDKSVVYVLSFYYYTKELPDRALNVWIQRDQEEQPLFNQRLPSTDGHWWRAAIFVWDRIDGKIGFYLRSFEPGSVYFDDVRLYQVQEYTGANSASEPRLVMRNAD